MIGIDEMRKALGEPFPTSAIKQRVGGGGSRFQYVEGYTIIRRLNEATGGQWDWAIRSFEFRPLPPLTDRKTGELKEQSLVVVTGELTIPGLGTRAGVGVQKVSENGGEDLVKGASTDALKKAATLFGVALDLYGPDYEGGEVAPAQRPAPRTAAPAFTQPRPAPAAAPQPVAPPDAPGDEALLDMVRNDFAGPDERWDALWDFYNKAGDVADLNRRAEQVKASGMPTRELEAAYRQKHTALARQFAPASIAG